MDISSEPIAPGTSSSATNSYSLAAAPAPGTAEGGSQLSSLPRLNKSLWTHLPACHIPRLKLRSESRYTSPNLVSHRKIPRKSNNPEHRAEYAQNHRPVGDARLVFLELMLCGINTGPNRSPNNHQAEKVDSRERGNQTTTDDEAGRRENGNPCLHSRAMCIGGPHFSIEPNFCGTIGYWDGRGKGLFIAFFTTA